MATDARNHTVPAATDHPSRATILALALAIRDVIPVTNTTTRAAVITAMSSAGVPVSAANPVVVYRADARPDSALEVTVDGTNWLSLGLSSGLTSYIPALTAVTTSPTLGTGSSATGQFRTDGQYCDGTADVVFGTGPTAGSGNYAISLPAAAPALASAVTSASAVGGGAFFIGSRFYILRLFLLTSTTCRLVVADTGTFVSNSNPTVPVATNRYNLEFHYPVA